MLLNMLRLWNYLYTVHLSRTAYGVYRDGLPLSLINTMILRV